jgi:hypothetical protein
MPGVFARPTFDPPAGLHEATAWLMGLKAARRSLILGAMIALATFTVLAEARAQTGKAPVSPEKEKPSTKPEDLYGDQGKEKVAAADARAPNTVMRARREDTFLKISNPRVDPKANAFLVDYEVVSRGKLDGGTLILRTEDGGRSEVALKSIEGRDSGTIKLVGVKFFGNLKIRTKTTFPEDVELYVIRGDDRYDPPLKCMVSNSVVMGKMKAATRPRDWTTEEIAQYTKAPPAYKNPNAHPTIGEDVPALPAATGLQQFRYVNPDGPLLGLDYLIGDWDKRKTVWRLTPVYAADQPKQHTARLIARKGYAVAGAEVNMDKYVCGIRLHFCRVKPDGTLDMKDTYASEWIGASADEGKATKLVNDGRRVLGINFQQGAIVDRFALVAEDKAK